MTFQAAPRLPEPLWRALLARLQAEAKVELHGAFVHLPTHATRLSVAEAELAQRVAVPLQQAGAHGAWVRDLASTIDAPESLVRATLARLARRGELHQVVKHLYFASHTIARLGGIARELAAANGGAVLAAVFRDVTGLGRRRAIQILEHFDRIGLLRRVGNLHWLRADSRLFDDTDRSAHRHCRAAAPCRWKGNDPGGSAGLQTQWVAPCAAGWVRPLFPSANALRLWRFPSRFHGPPAAQWKAEAIRYAEASRGLNDNPIVMARANASPDRRTNGFKLCDRCRSATGGRDHERAFE